MSRRMITHEFSDELVEQLGDELLNVVREYQSNVGSESDSATVFIPEWWDDIVTRWYRSKVRVGRYDYESVEDLLVEGLGFEICDHIDLPVVGTQKPPNPKRPPWMLDLKDVDIDADALAEELEHGPRDARLKSAAREKWGDEWYLETYEDADGDVTHRIVHTDELVADGIVIRDYLTVGEHGEIRQDRRLVDTEHIVAEVTHDHAR